jgi:iron complex outermembrane receptor protein
MGVPDGTVLFDLETVAVGQYADVPGIDYGDYAARLQLNWQVNDETLAFLSYNRGIKGGNWSPGADVNIENFKHKEETLHSYELGLKTSLAEGKARLNTTIFYYDYEDYQAFSLLNLIPQVTNSDATSVGGEIELTLLPTVNWDIMLGVSFIDSEIEASPGASPGSVIEDAEFPSAPGFSFNYLVRYNWDVMSGNMAVQLDGVYNDDQYLEGHNGGSSLVEAYNTTNASINYTTGDGYWNTKIWVKNITDEEYAIYSLDVGGFVIQQYAPPRWYGATVSYNW